MSQDESEVGADNGQVKNCHKCKKEIDKKASQCPFCQAAQPNAKQMISGCLIIIVIALILGSCISKCGGPPAMVDTKLPKVDTKLPKVEQFEQAEKLKLSAFLMGKHFVKERLKAPSTAKFEDYNPTTSVMWWKDNEFVCKVKVDAQNSFGAMIHSLFMAKVKYVGDDKWVLQAMEEVK